MTCARGGRRSPPLHAHVVVRDDPKAVKAAAHSVGVGHGDQLVQFLPLGRYRNAQGRMAIDPVFERHWYGTFTMSRYSVASMRFTMCRTL